jgi:hypothetical protein
MVAFLVSSAEQIGSLRDKKTRIIVITWLTRLWYCDNKTRPQYKVKRFQANISAFILNIRDPQQPSGYASGVIIEC